MSRLAYAITSFASLDLLWKLLERAQCRAAWQRRPGDCSQIAGGLFWRKTWRCP
jgi:hypothetical protein